MQEPKADVLPLIGWRIIHDGRKLGRGGKIEIVCWSGHLLSKAAVYGHRPAPTHALRDRQYTTISSAEYCK